MDERIKKLRAQVDELLEWKRANSRQQIDVDSFGARSLKIFQKNHLVVTGKTATGSLLDSDLTLEVKVGDDFILLPAITSQ